jgi:fructose-1-phosphate kinase PfkB-like protein
MHWVDWTGRSSGRSRRNLTLVSVNDPRPAAHFRAPGFDLEGSSALAELTDLVAAQVAPGDVVTINGSVPQGAAPDAWTTMAGVAVGAGSDLIVDVYGRDLPSVLRRAGCGVLACTPNATEIEDLPGVSGAAGDDRYVAALRFMADQGVRLPVVTRGPDGALFAHEGSIWTARCSVLVERVSVGAGDAFTGALAAGAALGHAAGHELVRFAIAVATAHVEAIPLWRLLDQLPAIRDRVAFERWRDL